MTTLGAREVVGRPMSGAGRGSGSFETTQYPHLFDLLRILSKRRWPAITAFVAVVVIGAAYTYTQTPIYEARVQLQIDSDKPKVVVFDQAIQSDSEKQEYQQTQVMILQSRALARRTIETLHLWTYPELSGRPDSAQRSPLQKVMGSVGAVANAIVARFTKTPSDDDPATQKGAADTVAETAAQSRTIGEFLNRLTVTPIRSSRLVDVNFRSENASLAQLAANTLVKAYVDQNVEFKSASSKEASEWLSKQLDEQRRQVDASQSALQQYRERTDSLSNDEAQNPAVQKLIELQGALTRARTERIQKQAAYQQISAAQADPKALETLPVILLNPFIQALRSEVATLQRQAGQLRDNLGERHPEMVKLQRAIDSAQERLGAEQLKAIEAVHNDLLAAQGLEGNLAQAVEVQKREALAVKRKAIEGNSLERNASSDREIFEALLQRAKEAGVSGGLPASNIRIVDAADVPRTPISPRKDRNMLVSFLGGLFLAVGTAFFFEYLDKGLKSPEDVKAQLGLNCLGLVPLVEAAEDGSPALLNHDVPPAFQEAFRTVRTNVIFGAAGESTLTLLITSTGPHEGKTLVAANLSIALAQTGQRVLLIDADMRRSKVHTMFGVSQEPGLSDLATGQVQASRVIRPSGVEGLWLLTAGQTPEYPSEILSSPRFKKFVTAVGAAFDWVIIDSPPVMAVTDASVIANLVSGVLFVVGADATFVRSAQNALEQLEGAQARFVGAVLNRVDLQRNAFFYSYYYRPEYTDYYTKRPTE